MIRQVQTQQVKFANNAETSTTNQNTVPVRLWGGKNSFQIVLTGDGAVSVTATPQFSNNATNWIAGTGITVSGTDSATNGVTVDSGWAYVRIALSSITGTGATASVFHGGLAA